MSNAKQKITIDPQMNIQDFIMEYPQLVDVLSEEYGFHCVNCLFSSFDTLIEGAAIHQIEGDDFVEMINHLESLINDEKIDTL
jgi:hybrid cluster-associated redox disulfide protein